MKGNIRALYLLAAILLITACSESAKETEFSNWQERNEAFVDSLATAVSHQRVVTPQEASEGQMFRILSYRLNPDATDLTAGDYVYCKVLRKGTGKESPIYNDSIKINYRGRLIPTVEHPEGFVFDQSYKTPQLDESINIPAHFILSGLVNGMITSVSNMREGDFWRIYIPYQLGYNDMDHNTVPAYSTLVFDVNLVKFSRGNEKL